MSEVLIGFRRPESMSEADLRAWVDTLAAAAPPAITLESPDGSVGGGVLRVTAHSEAATLDQLADLMLDMRLLGLQPKVVSGPGVRPLRTLQ